MNWKIHLLNQRKLKINFFFLGPPLIGIISLSVGRSITKTIEGGLGLVIGGVGVRKALSAPIMEDPLQFDENLELLIENFSSFDKFALLQLVEVVHFVQLFIQSLKKLLHLKIMKKKKIYFKNRKILKIVKIKIQFYLPRCLPRITQWGESCTGTLHLRSLSSPAW